MLVHASFEAANLCRMLNSDKGICRVRHLGCCPSPARAKTNMRKKTKKKKKKEQDENGKKKAGPVIKCTPPNDPVPGATGQDNPESDAEIPT